MRDRRCPCGTGEVLTACCGPWLEGAEPPTAERLMRSRYTAFALGDAAHLRRTWHPATRPRRVSVDGTTWTRLTVHAAAGGLFDARGEVTFTARHTGGEVRERSTFVRVEGSWRYLGGVDPGEL